MSSRTRKLETVREAGDERVIGESGVAMSAGCDVRDAAAAIAFNGPWTVHRNRVAAETVHDSGIDGDDVPGTAETIAGAESVANGNAFHASAEAEGKMAHAGDSMGEAAAEKILVSDGHDRFASAGTEGGNAVGVRGIEKPGALEVEHGMKPDLAIGLGRERKAPAAIAGLERLIGNCGDRLPIQNRRAFAVADAGGNFQTTADGDVAVAFGGWTENPGLHAHLHVADAANAINTNRRIDLIARALEYGNVCDDAPAARELIVDADIEKELVIFDLVVKELPLSLFVCSDEVAEGIKFAEADGDGQATEPCRIVIVWTARDRAAAAEFVHDALVRTSSHAALRMSTLKRACDEKRIEKNTNCTERHKSVEGRTRAVPLDWIRTRPNKLARFKQAKGKAAIIQKCYEARKATSIRLRRFDPRWCLRWPDCE